MPADLQNPRSDRVKRIRALTTASGRRRQGLYLVEGPQGVREAVRFARARIRDLYLTESALERYPEILRAAGDMWVHTATPEVIEAMSPDAQGVLAVLVPARPGLEVLDGALLVAALTQARDPGNVGTVIRAVDAAGGDAVVLTDQSVDVLNPKLVRSTAGSLFHLPVADGVGDLAALVIAARAAGLQVLAADGAGPLDLDGLADSAGSGGEIDLARPTLWVFGNEAHGLAEAEAALADAVVRIPLGGHAESLNLAMAATLCLFASARAQRR